MNDQIVVLAIDPGKMTGWAELRLGEFHSGQSETEAFLAWLDEVLEAGLRPSIVCEDFIYTSATAKKTRQTWSTETIGVVRFLARKYDVNFTMQTPAAAKSFATNDKLKALGWYRATKGGHANDAARHLLLYCVSRQLIDPRQLLDHKIEEN